MIDVRVVKMLAQVADLGAKVVQLDGLLVRC
jgi:hypothetical protein